MVAAVSCDRVCCMYGIPKRYVEGGLGRVDVWHVQHTWQQVDVQLEVLYLSVPGEAGGQEQEDSFTSSHLHHLQQPTQQSGAYRNANRASVRLTRKPLAEALHRSTMAAFCLH